MKKAVIINLSPRKTGTSVMLANRCQAFLTQNDHQTEILHLYPHLKDLSPVLKAIDESSAIIMIGPCYIDCFPADTVFLLEQIEKNKKILHGQNLYGIIQGGMPTVHTHESGLKMLELFAFENNISYKGGFVIGLGALLNGQTLDKLPNGKKVEVKFNLFLKHIAKGENSPAALYQKAQLKMPGVVYWFMARGMNKRIDKDRKERGIDDAQLNPYAQNPVN